MNKIEKQFKKDFVEIEKIDLSFDKNQLEKNTKFTKHLFNPTYKKLVITFSILGVISAIIIVPLTSLMGFYLHKSTSVKFSKKNISMNEIKIAETNTFKRLNDISYPSSTQAMKSSISIDMYNSYNNFSNETYKALIETSKKDNMSYSIANLYSILNELYSASSRSDLTISLDNLLGVDESKRKTFINSLMHANSFANENSTTQIKNAIFLDNKYSYSEEFVNKLSNLYCETYQLDLTSDVNKILTWVYQAVNSFGFIDKEYLNIDEFSTMFLFSTLYFNNAWENKFICTNNFDANFYLNNGDTTKATYLSHSYMVDCYYDYGKYISVKDYYKNNAATITYLVPKSIDDNIFELTKDQNIFIEKEENKIINEDDAGFFVHLTAPKSSYTYDVDFKNSLTKLGLGDIFNPGVDSFKNAFTGELSDINFYLDSLKQKNEITFSEEGTMIKSVSMGAGKEASSPYGALDVDLDQPYIYIIKDINDIPIFVGHVDDPSH